VLCAPANCGPTRSGTTNIAGRICDGKWDIIHFNFGIYDGGTHIADYIQRLEQLVERMKKKTGAQLGRAGEAVANVVEA